VPALGCGKISLHSNKGVLIVGFDKLSQRLDKLSQRPDKLSQRLDKLSQRLDHRWRYLSLSKVATREF
jgi:VanZ family protein